MAETAPFDGHPQNPDGVSHVESQSVAPIGSEGLNSESCGRSLVVAMSVENNARFDAMDIDSVVTSPLKEHDSSLKGGNSGKSPIHVDLQSSSSGDDETDTGDDGETIGNRSQFNPHLDDSCYYHDRRFSRFYNHHHPSLNRGLWGRDHTFRYNSWLEHPPSRVEGECRDYWRREPPGFSVPMYRVEPTALGAGLSNLGNTCFMNAILQCFTHTVPLVKALRSCSHVSSSNGACEEFCVLCALHEHVDLSLKSSGKVLSPSKFFDNLTHISSCFEKYQQEDAHEFLQCLLDRLERCCLDSGSNGESSSSQNENMVKQVFGGRLVSKLECCNCGECYDKYEPLVDLSLEIEDANTLDDALESFTKVETMDDPEAKFKCESCEVESSRKKQLLVDQAPLVATFHLKRFKSDGSNIEKIGKHVEFPLELNLTPYINSSADSDMELKYQLYAIVVHNGFFPTSGHYFSYVRSSPGTWHKLDDSTVFRVEEEYVLSQAPYILFYVKDGTPWFSNVMEIEMLRVGCISNTSPKSVLENVDGAATSLENEASTATNMDDHETATTRDVEAGTTKYADEVEPMLEVVRNSDTRDTAERISFNDTDASGPDGSNLGCNNSRGGISDASFYATTDGSSAIPTGGIKSVHQETKENDSFLECKGIEKGGSHLDSHERPERRCRDHPKVANRVNCKRSLGKGGRTPGKGAAMSERREAMRLIQNMGNSSKRNKLMALLPKSEKKRCRNSPRKKDSPSHSRQLSEEGQEGRRVRICRESKQFNTMKRTCLFQGA